MSFKLLIKSIIIFLLVFLTIFTLLFKVGNNFTAKGRYDLNSRLRSETLEYTKRLVSSIKHDGIKIKDVYIDEGCEISHIPKELIIKRAFCNYSYKATYSSNDPRNDFLNLHQEIEQAGWIPQQNLDRFYASKPYTVNEINDGNIRFEQKDISQKPYPSLRVYMENDSGKRNYGYSITTSYANAACRFCYIGTYFPK